MLLSLDFLSAAQINHVFCYLMSIVTHIHTYTHIKDWQMLIAGKSSSRIGVSWDFFHICWDVSCWSCLGVFYSAIVLRFHKCCFSDYQKSSQFPSRPQKYPTFIIFPAPILPYSLKFRCENCVARVSIGTGHTEVSCSSCSLHFVQVWFSLMMHLCCRELCWWGWFLLISVLWTSVYRKKLGNNPALRTWCY